MTNHRKHRDHDEQRVRLASSDDAASTRRRQSSRQPVTDVSPTSPPEWLRYIDSRLRQFCTR